ncbi:MAG: hypothetical protein AB7N71_05470 [Phycisphaerae bacterium]
MTAPLSSTANAASVARRRAIRAVVRDTARVCAEHTRLVLAIPDFPASQPGQFVQVICTDVQQAGNEVCWNVGQFPQVQNPEMHARHAFLCRPFSIGDRFVDESGVDCITIISRNIGPGTAWLEQVRVGQHVQLMGPMGVPFVLPSDERIFVLVGGGVGIPPLLYLARALREARHANSVVFFGVRNRALLPVPISAEPASDGTALPCLRLPGDANFPVVVASDDGSIGVPGTVIDAMNAWQARNGINTAHVQIAACGPDAMLRAVAHHARSWDARCQLCIERTMGCGSGTCLSCIVRVNDSAAPQGSRWALSCSEGPVFDRDVLVGY